MEAAGSVSKVQVPNYFHHFLLPLDSQKDTK